MKIERLQELKQKLVSEADLSEIWLFYMDNFADHQEFTDLGEPVHHEYISNVIHKTCHLGFGKVKAIDGLLLIHIPQYQFIHGPFQYNRRIGGVIYFEDIKIGLIAVSADFPPTDSVKYSRFSEVMRLSEPRGNELN